MYVVMLSQDELASWRISTAVLLVVSALIFVGQRLNVVGFDLAFEVSVFYLPALFSLAVYLWYTKRKAAGA